MTPSPGENVREFYRRQGEQRMLESVIAELQDLHDEKPNAAWSPKYIIDLLKGINETRKDSDSQADS